MELVKKMASRLVITGLLLLGQIFIIGFLAFRLATSLPIVVVLSWILSVIIIYHLVRKDEPSTYKTIWIIIIMGMPALGGILYLIFEQNPRIKRIDARINAEHKKMAGILAEDSDICNDTLEQVGDRINGCARYIHKVSSYHPYRSTSSKYYNIGEAMFEDMLADMKKAEKFIFVEYFIITESKMWDMMMEILVDKAARGVDVRLIVDGLGGGSLFTRQYVKEVREKGIKVIRFNPLTPILSLFMNNRNHRKILIIDGHTAFNGGINISDEYINLKPKYGIWKDTGVRIEGGAVSSFTHMFMKIWNTFCLPKERIIDHMAYRCTGDFAHLTDGLIMPYDDSPLDGEPLGENVYINILNQARRYVYIFTPYLIIGDRMIYALKMAAKRGVDVRIVTPGIPDSKIVERLTRSYYAYLLQSGVKIYEYSLGFMHAKSFVSDDEIAVVGTINLDYRSLYLHFECATLLYESNAINDIKQDVLDTLADSKEISLADVKERPWDSFVTALLRVLAPLM